MLLVTGKLQMKYSPAFEDTELGRGIANLVVQPRSALNVPAYQRPRLGLAHATRQRQVLPKSRQSGDALIPDIHPSGRRYLPAENSCSDSPLRPVAIMMLVELVSLRKVIPLTCITSVSRKLSRGDRHARNRRKGGQFGLRPTLETDVFRQATEKTS